MILRHARPHVRKFWRFQVRRTIGLTFAMFGIVYGIGVLFTTMLTSSFIVNPLNILLMWIILLFIVLATAVGSIVSGHRKTSKYLNYQESMKHSRNIGIFLVGLVFGTTLLALPVLLMPDQASLMMLFTMGSITFLVYGLLLTVFGHSYHELGIAGAFMLIVFIAGAVSLASVYQTNPPAFDSLSFLLTSVTIITVFPVTGLFMVNRASTEFIGEFKKINKIRF